MNRRHQDKEEANKERARSMLVTDEEAPGAPVGTPVVKPAIGVDARGGAPLAASDIAAFRAALETLQGFTRGPWQVFSACEEIGVTPEEPGEGDVAHCSGFSSRRGDEVVRANARLMAASPALHDMCGRLLDENDRLRRAVAHANDHADQAIAHMKALQAELDSLRSENAASPTPSA